MKKLLLDEFELESFVTTPDLEARLGTVHGRADEDITFTDHDSCNFTCAQSCAPFTCYDTCRFTC
ncbi:hypothetical protein SAMN05216486_10393 [bacterium JGI 053]|nr:hypothetical protein SAMN05216486_10393 [bacterium JGI 053]